jgi:Ca-activated chloride channel family protein
MITIPFHRQFLARPAGFLPRTAALLMSTTLAAGGSPAGHTPAADVHFDSDTQLVTIKMPFGDPRAATLTDVHPDSFVVYEDGRRQENVSVAVEHPSLSIGVLLEYGGRYHELNEILGAKAANAARSLLEQTGPTDSVAVWKYADGVDPIASESAAPDGLQRSLVSLPTPPFSELNFHDALLATLPKMQAMSGNKALVLISTGLDTFSKASFAAVLAETRKAGVPIYVINLGPLIQSDLPPYAAGANSYGKLNWAEAESELDKLARASGGRMYSPESQLDLNGVYDELMASLRTRYVIQYKAQESERHHPPRVIEVELVNARRLRAAAWRAVVTGPSGSTS